MKGTHCSRLALSVLVLAIAGNLSIASADILHVPGNYATIQAAITAAKAGDEVHIADGTYSGAGNYNISFMGKEILVRSVNGPAKCIIDCRGAGRGFLFTSYETFKSVLEGVTIRNGFITQALGAGMEVTNSSPTIRNCVFEDNVSEPYNGGGMHLGSNCIAKVIGCVFRGGRAGGGAAMHCEYSAPLLLDCLFENNTSGVGGAVLCTGSNARFVNCLFIDNEATDPVWGGAAIFCNASSYTEIVNCTITRNTATGLGGALYSNKGSAPIVTNCIFWGNTKPEIEVSANSGTPQVTFCDVEGGYTGQGNINADPRFLSAATDVFRIGAGSACIDAGMNVAIGSGILIDLAGRKRFVDDPNTPDTGQGPPPVIDLGAYEYQPSLGDMNCDGAVDFGDINPFVLALSDPDAYRQQYPNCEWLDADINGDKNVDFGDINLFVQLLSE